MSGEDVKSTHRPYRKASEYLARRQANSANSGCPKTVDIVEAENLELREQLLETQRQLETLQVDYENCREHFVSQNALLRSTLSEKLKALEVMQSSYSKLQSEAFDQTKKLSKIAEVERDRDLLAVSARDSDDVIKALEENVKKLENDNAILREQWSRAATQLQRGRRNLRVKSSGNAVPRTNNHFSINPEQYNEYVNPCIDDGPLDGYLLKQDRHERRLLRTMANIHQRTSDKPDPPDPSMAASKRIAEHEALKSPSYRDPWKKPLHSSGPSSQQVLPSETQAPQAQTLWEKQRDFKINNPSPQPSSPWVHDPSQMKDFKPLQFNEFAYRYSPALIYGANPILYPKREPPKTYLRDVNPVQLPLGNAKITKKKAVTGKNHDVYIADDNVADSDDVQTTTSQVVNTSPSSHKSTPSREAERGSNAEKSSLLAENEDEVLMICDDGHKSSSSIFGLKSSYRTLVNGAEGRGLLKKESDTELDEIYEPYYDTESSDSSSSYSTSSTSEEERRRRRKVARKQKRENRKKIKKIRKENELACKNRREMDKAMKPHMPGHLLMSEDLLSLPVPEYTFADEDLLNKSFTPPPLYHTPPPADPLIPRTPSGGSSDDTDDPQRSRHPHVEPLALSVSRVGESGAFGSLDADVQKEFESTESPKKSKDPELGTTNLPIVDIDVTKESGKETISLLGKSVGEADESTAFVSALTNFSTTFQKSPTAHHVLNSTNIDGSGDLSNKSLPTIGEFNLSKVAEEVGDPVRNSSAGSPELKV